MKKIAIGGGTRLSYLAAHFQKQFPFLLLRFYKHKHEPRQSSPDEDELDPDKIVSEVSEHFVEGELFWDEKMSVEDFENLLEKQFGLHVQVYRKSHGLWLQSWATDMWTLEEQNRRGEILGSEE